MDKFDAAAVVREEKSVTIQTPNSSLHTIAIDGLQQPVTNFNPNEGTALPITVSSNGQAVMSVPLAMPLTGLTTVPVPLAICTVNGSGNPGNNVLPPNGVQGGGLLLLNVPGNNNGNLTSISQLMTAQVQQNQQLIFGNNTMNLQSSSLNVQPNPLMKTQSSQNLLNVNLSQIIPSNGQIQPPVVPQGGAAAYMLVPIHQVPSTNQPLSLQHSITNLSTQQPIVSGGEAVVVECQSTSKSMPSNVSVPESSIKFNQASYHHNNLSSTSWTTLSEVTPAVYGINSEPNTRYSPSMSMGSIAHSSDKTQNLQMMAASAAVNVSGTCSSQGSATRISPIHDPHISSTVHSVAKDMPVLLNSADLPVLNMEKTYGVNYSDMNPVGQSHSTCINSFSVVQSFSPSTIISTASTTTTSLNHTLQSVNAASFADLNYVSKSPHEVYTTSGVPNLTSTDIQASISTSSPATGLSKKEAKGSIVVADTSHPVREKRRKGPAPKLDGNEVCVICEDKASGYHYSVLSCEGCKGFFRRSIIKNPKYTCRGDGNCQMDTYMRRKCQSCRLNKCRSAGMKDESVLSEVDGGKAKRIKKEGAGFVASPLRFAPNLSFHGEPVPSLSLQQRNLVEMLQENETRFQWPTQEDVAKVTPWIESGDTHRCRAERFAHFTELAILIVQLVVEFTKQLPGFLTVSREDQIVLLKACTIEVMLLRAAKQYDKKSKTINFLNGKFYDRSSFYRAGMQVEFVDPIFEFCNSMAKLGLDEAEYALLAAINTFSSDRPNIKDLRKVEAVQESYVELLKVYLQIHHPEEPLMFARTLMKLVELRTLNSCHSEQIFALKVQDKKLPPLLAEIWDM